MTKVHLILGFLGAGKTTFLKKVLHKPELQNESIMLIVNDYGLENYDAQELKQEGVELMEITNGCLCCSYKNQFEEALMACADKKNLERIFIEPSGLFFPDQVIEIFEKEPLRSSMKLEPIVAIVDYALLSGKKLWPPAIERLIEAGQLIVKNKIDMVSSEDQQNVEKRIKQLNKHALYNFEEAVNNFPYFKDDKYLSYYSNDLQDADHGINYIQLSDGLEFQDQAALLSYLMGHKPTLIRAKGNVLLGGKLVYVNYINKDLNIQPSYAEARIGLSCFMDK